MQIIGQHFLTKSVLKPSGPGDLSEGRLLTIESISNLVKGWIRKSRLACGDRRPDRSKPTEVKLEVPSLSLKDSQIRSALA